MFVMLGHSIGVLKEPINWFILSFHMPAFYFISGVCLNLSTRKDTVLEGVCHKARTTGYQYLVFSILGLFYYWTIRSRLGNNLHVTFNTSLFNIFVGKNIVPGFWFVYDLLIITVLYIVIQNVRRRELYSFVLFFLLFVFFSYNVDETYYNGLAHRLTGGGTFYSVGAMLSQYIRDNKISLLFKQLSCQLWLLIAFSLSLGIVLIAFLNKPVVMAVNDYGNIWLFLSGAFLACIVLAIISEVIGKNKILEYIGVNSIIFLFIHFYILDFSHFLFNFLFVSGLNNSFPFYLLHFIVAILGSFGFAWIINKYIPFLIRI